MTFERIAAALLAVALSSAALAHGQSILVTGTVANSAGIGVPGVGIELNGGVTFPIPVVTGATGAFSFSAPPGTYDVTLLPDLISGVLPTVITGFTIPAVGPVSMGTITLQDAFTLSGSVLDTLGAPVIVADINVYDQFTGTKLFTPDDTTDAFGNFVVLVPAGTFRVRVRPPVGTLLVAEEIENVVVSGPTTVPTFTLDPGVILTGVVRDSQTMMPLVDVDLDVIDPVTGDKVVTPGDNTDSSGVFTLIAPIGTWHVTFEPTLGLTHVARMIENYVIPSSLLPVNMGIITLDPGFILSGTVLGPGMMPVVGADIDVDTVLGGVRILTPRDNTDASGQFAVVVPAGTYSITVEPVFSSGLVGGLVTPVTVVANTMAPTVNLLAGTVVSGTVLAWNGLPEVGADIDISDPTTGQAIVTPSDQTDATGAYAVLVPPGTWTMEIQTEKLSLSRDLVVQNLMVGAMPVTSNHQLSLVPVGVFVGPDQQGPFPQGGVVPLTIAWFNPYPVPQNTTLELKLRDPSGTETTIVPPIPLVVTASQFFFLPAVPVPLPPINPAYAGLSFEFILRFRDAVTGEEYDSDRSSFVIQ